jgi:hypothetical protein
MRIKEGGKTIGVAAKIKLVFEMSRYTVQFHNKYNGNSLL